MGAGAHHRNGRHHAGLVGRAHTYERVDAPGAHHAAWEAEIEVGDVYTPENLEQELTFTAEAFISSGGAALDRENRRISLSQVFKWYARDFGATQAERLRFIALYLFQAQDRAVLEDQADTLQVSYQRYDWPLNRG